MRPFTQCTARDQPNNHLERSKEDFVPEVVWGCSPSPWPVAVCTVHVHIVCSVHCPCIDSYHFYCLPSFRWLSAYVGRGGARHAVRMHATCAPSAARFQLLWACSLCIICRTWFIKEGNSVMWTPPMQSEKQQLKTRSPLLHVWMRLQAAICSKLRSFLETMFSKWKKSVCSALLLLQLLLSFKSVDGGLFGWKLLLFSSYIHLV